MAQVLRSSIGGALRTISKKSPTFVATRYWAPCRHNSSHAMAPSLKPFAGKVITVTGGARGIGLATARYLAARGATVCISDVLEKDLEKAEEGICRDFPDVNVRKAVVDVSKSEEVKKWIEDVKFEFGELNGCVNNAGISHVAIKAIEELSDEEFMKVININLVGTFNCLRAQLKEMAHAGSIVNLSSVAGHVGTPGLAPYCASKHAILGLTRTAAKEAAWNNIRVNAVCPGIVQTAMIEHIHEDLAISPESSPQVIKREAKPEEIAAMIAYLLGEESKFTTGTSMMIDGGWTS